MDKKVILSVAGSGKTTYIINQLNLEKRFLILTYTLINLSNLRNKIIQKFGYFPENIMLFSYFNFLYTFCYRPFLSLKLKSSGISFESVSLKYVKKDDIKKYYFDEAGRLLSNRLADLLLEKKVLSDIKSRISKYFDYLFIDEVQDFGGHDFNFLMAVYQSGINIIAVGDFYQHTYDTSRDGGVNKNLHSNLNRYLSEIGKTGIQLDTTTLNVSHRCSPSICEFIQKHLGIEIASSRIDVTKVEIIDNPKEADEIFSNERIVKLFYKENHKYKCFSRNWGECKGEDIYGDVCVVLTSDLLKMLKKNDLTALSPTTKNKFYVACSRARGSLYLVPGLFYKKFKRQ